MKFHYVAPMYYLPMQYAISLVKQGRTRSEAAQMAIDRFAYYGKHNTKRLKEFDQNQFRRSLNKFIDTPYAVLVRKSPRH